jgi:hypothetical protein
MVARIRNLLVVAIAVGFFYTSGSTAQSPPPDRYIEVELKVPPIVTNPTLDAAAIEAFRQWRFKPKNVHPQVIPIPPILVPPPRDHESSRCGKTIS